MTKYISIGINLTEYQKNKIKTAYSTGSNVKLRLNKSDLSNVSNTKLLLTPIQLHKLQSDTKDHDITISHKRLGQHITGGFLPFILPALAGLASLAGISSGIAGTIAGAKRAQRG